CLTHASHLRCDRAAIRTGISSEPDLCVCRGLSAGLVGLQRGSDGAATPAFGIPTYFIDDGNNKPDRRGGLADHRWTVSIDALQAWLSPAVPVPPWIPDESMEKRIVWCFPHGPETWYLLRGLLLGTNAASICRRRNEFDCHCGVDGICGIR